MIRKRALIMLLLLGTLFACGLNNTMYNARKYFRDAQARPLNSNGRPTPQAVEEYTKAIQKCGIILTERKDSKIVDDALFLMAKALYFKGNSAFQAKDQFEALIAGFPDSPHIPDAYIFLAKVLREVNRPQESEKLLEEFVRNQKFIKHHPRALLTLADFEILDKDYYRAQFWLERLIAEYPKTKEFNEAYLLFGKNYYVQGDYNASLREFEKLTGFRRVDKGIRLEARYYIAMNYFEKGNYERSSKLVQSLLNDETRPDKLSMIRVLNARLLFATGKSAEGITEVDAIARAYPRTIASATAYYYVGDHHFYSKNDINLATTSYNRVRTEFPNAELVTIAQRKVAALNQLKQRQNLSFKTNPQQFADYHTLAAENYLDPFALPDSALVMYDRIILVANPLYAERDSLFNLKAAKQVELDSLNATVLSIPAEDMKAPVNETEEKSDPESTVDIGLADSLAVGESDLTLDETLLDISAKDSTAVSSTKQTNETTDKGAGKPSATEIQARKDTLSRDIQRLEQQITSLISVLVRFEMEIQPFAMFAKANLINKLGRDKAEIDAIFSLMQTKYTAHKYTNALRALINGEPVRLVDPEEERLEKSLDMALGLYPAQADSMLIILGELKESRYPLIKLRANFRLGWYYSFEARDTTLAKPYLDAVLQHEQGGDYATLTRRFYDGTNYVKIRDITKVMDEANETKDTIIESEDTPKPEDKEPEGKIIEKEDTRISEDKEPVLPIVEHEEPVTTPDPPKPDENGELSPGYGL
jgi:TolA-binding protein